MSTTFKTKPATRFRLLAIVAGAAIGSTLIAFQFTQDDAAQDAVKQSAAPAAATVFGPGAWTEPHADASDPVQAGPSRAAPPGGLEATESGELVINTALLDVINFFLLEQSDSDRANALNIYLQSKLPVPARREAEEIARHYQTYMTEHDSLLAVQNLDNQTNGASSLDLSRIATWREQRDRLRKYLLGDKAVQAWYQNDDAQLQQVLGELQQRKDGASPAQEPDPSTSTGRPTPPVVPRWSSVNDEVHHNAYMQGVLAKATASFSKLAGERRQWAIPYSAFADAASQVAQDSRADSFERNLQIQALLKKYFPAEAERQLARDRWENMNGPLN